METGILFFSLHADNVTGNFCDFSGDSDLVRFPISVDDLGFRIFHRPRFSSRAEPDKTAGFG